MQIHAKTLAPIIIDFLKTYYGQEEADEFSKLVEVTEKDSSNNPLIKAGGFNALLKTFLKQNPAVKKALAKVSQEESSSESDESSDEEEKKPVKKVAKKAAKPKKEESDSSDSSSEEEEKQPAKKQKAKVVKKEESDSSSSEEEDKPAQKRKAETERQETTKRQKVSEEDDSSEDTNEQPQQNNPRTPYSRVKEDYANNLSVEFQDNSFEAKARYGGQGGDNYETRGKGFRKEKTKMKKKNFHGAGQKITYQVNSIKFD
ncbi:unnamed protein product [Moneuplotes crassus]|uniref:Srp40 C-terminal domain-containing protein n=1 Tax=Euplotes crassus TaxID=5936 RepID=A0AAD1XTF9_EUPCR|nr:unnamed protein product [Moneuplotes crassus]